MGNQQSFIKTQTDHNTYRGGDEVTGKVYCRFKEDLRAEHISISITTEEQCTWNKRNAENALIAAERAQDVFFNYSTVLYTWPRARASKGDYVFPFSIRLPLSAPSSFLFKDKTVKASIDYKIAAYVEGTSYHSELSFQVYSFIYDELQSLYCEKALPVQSSVVGPLGECLCAFLPLKQSTQVMMNCGSSLILMTQAVELT